MTPPLGWACGCGCGSSSGDAPPSCPSCGFPFSFFDLD